MNTNPHIIVLAGPNGAGKSTAAPVLLHQHLAVNEFVNADTIAKGLSAFRPEDVALKAGRIMLQRLRELADQHQSFAFETTLASRTFAPWLQRLRNTGYQVHLIFLYLPSLNWQFSASPIVFALAAITSPRRPFGAAITQACAIYSLSISH